MLCLTSSVSRRAGTLVEMQFKQLCTAEANVGVHVVLKSEGGFCCIWKIARHSVVHCGFNWLKDFAETQRCKDIQCLNRRG